MKRSLLQNDVWLSEQMSRQCFSLDASKVTDARVLAEELKSIKSPFFVFSKIAPLEVLLINDLENLGFRLVDTNLTFQKSIASSFEKFTNFSFRITDPGDRQKVTNLAATVFTVSRFHLDPKIPKNLANQIKKSWVDNFYLGKRGEQIVVAEDSKGEVCGFLLLLRSHAKWIIDLVGVEESQQGKGVGRGMISFAQEKLAQSEDSLVVGTQLANAQSIKSYLGMGFKLESSKYVFHIHG